MQNDSVQTDSKTSPNSIHEDCQEEEPFDSFAVSESQTTAWSSSANMYPESIPFISETEIDRCIVEGKKGVFKYTPVGRRIVDGNRIMFEYLPNTSIWLPAIPLLGIPERVISPTREVIYTRPDAGQLESNTIKASTDT